MTNAKAKAEHGTPHLTLSRHGALELMHAWTRSESLRNHMLAVESATAAYARHYGADETLWRVTAILHDFDYEKHPEANENAHPFVGVAYLCERGYPEEVLEAIMGHADYSGVPRESLLAKALYACDEVTGLVTAAVLVRPDKDIGNLELKSLKKKFKDKAFARGVNRDDVLRGADELGVELWEHVTFVLGAMKADAEALGLDGSRA